MIAPVLRVYIAASYGRKAECKRLAEILRKRGVIVTSEWLDSEQSSKTQPQWAEIDVRCMNEARGILFFAEEPTAGYMTGGRHFELGWMARSGDKYLWVVGGKENVFHNLSPIQHYPTVIDWARKILVPSIEDERDAANLILEVADVPFHHGPKLAAVK